jgi:outer membrane protein OmpA-like peptidoglycan-associated protein
VKGQVKNDSEDIPLAAKIELRNLNTSEITQVDYDTLTGDYSSVVLFDADYIMTVKKEGFAYNSEYFAKDDTTIKDIVERPLDLKKLTVGQAYKLNNILFPTASAELNTASKNIITDFGNFLKDNPKVIVAIHGHTDSAGDSNANMKLSNERANSVYSFLIKSGINASRLSFKGFGQTKPLVENDTEDGRSKNRRTEFVIINK